VLIAVWFFCSGCVQCWLGKIRGRCTGAYEREMETWISGSGALALELLNLRWQSLFVANFEFSATVSPEEAL